MPRPDAFRLLPFAGSIGMAEVAALGRDPLFTPA
jgi:hypothetical protein